MYGYFTAKLHQVPSCTENLRLLRGLAIKHNKFNLKNVKSKFYVFLYSV